MSTETQKVDVLYAIDVEIASHSVHAPQRYTLQEVRAAVAELIEADREFDRLVFASRNGTPGEKYKVGAQLKQAAERREIALAHIGGDV